jgi:cell division protein FtsQ
VVEIAGKLAEEVYKDEIFIKKLSSKIKSELKWVSKVRIAKSLPDALNISVVEYEPLAIWESENKKYVIDKDGNKIAIDDGENFDKLLILSGDEANLNAKSLFNILAIDSKTSADIYSATFVGKRRWDVRFESGLIVKLPENKIEESWKELIKIYNMPRTLDNVDMIDLRVDGKIYLKLKHTKPTA